MPFSLYDAVIPQYRQMLGALPGLLDKAEAWCAAKGVAPADLIQARLAPDMLPFSFQVKSAAVHSAGAIEGVRQGLFKPDMNEPPNTFAGLKERIAAAQATIEKITPEEMESFIGRDMKFVSPARELDFTAERFLLSFSQPNFYFHTTTTYAILRGKGVEIGKRDYTGKLQIKR
jgi:hypothetical protein